MKTEAEQRPYRERNKQKKKREQENKQKTTKN